MGKKRKIYLVANPADTGVRFDATDRSMHGFRAGGSAEKPKRILQALNDLYGIEEAKEIYTKYNKAMLHLSTMNQEEFGGKTGCITLYVRGDNEEEDSHY